MTLRKDEDKDRASYNGIVLGSDKPVTKSSILSARICHFHSVNTLVVMSVITTNITETKVFYT